MDNSALCRRILRISDIMLNAACTQLVNSLSTTAVTACAQAVDNFDPETSKISKTCVELFFAKIINDLGKIRNGFLTFWS